MLRIKQKKAPESRLVPLDELLIRSEGLKLPVNSFHRLDDPANLLALLFDRRIRELCFAYNRDAMENSKLLGDLLKRETFNLYDFNNLKMLVEMILTGYRIGPVRREVILRGFEELAKNALYYTLRFYFPDLDVRTGTGENLLKKINKILSALPPEKCIAYFDFIPFIIKLEKSHLIISVASKGLNEENKEKLLDVIDLYRKNREKNEDYWSEYVFNQIAANKGEVTREITGESLGTIRFLREFKEIFHKGEYRIMYRFRQPEMAVSMYIKLDDDEVL